MAQVPISTGPSIGVRPLPDAHLIPVDQTAGLRAVGAALSQDAAAASEMSDVQLQMDNMRDQAAIKKQDAADAQWLRDQLWTGPDALYNKQGQAAVDAAGVLAQRFDERLQTNLAGLGNERQRHYYSQLAAQRFDQERVGMARFAFTAQHQEEDRQSLARLSSASDDFVVNMDDPTKSATAMERAMGEVRSRAATLGWSPEVMQRAETETRQNMITRGIKAKADRGDYESASASLEQYRDALGAQAPAIDAVLRDPLLDRQADGIKRMVMGTGAPIEDQTSAVRGGPQLLPRMVSITAHSESGSRERDSHGNLITSRAGAQGMMQVMPGTAANPGFGVRPAQDGSDAERSRVGRDVLAAMMQRYGNDPAKAWAAYNWGPGNLDKAIAAHPNDWLSHAPAETQAYVHGNMAALGGGAASSGTPQTRAMDHDVPALLARVDALNLPFDLAKRAKQQIIQQAGLDESSLREVRQRAEEQAWAAVEAKGPNGFTSMSQIPSAARANMTAQQRMGFEAIIARNTARNAPGTDWGAYSQYSDLFAADPGKFVRDHPPSELRAKLDDTEFKQVMGWRADVLKGMTGGTTNQATHARINQITEPLLLAAGISRPAEKRGVRAGDPEYWQRVGRFHQSVGDDVNLWQQRNPNKPIDDDTIQHIAERRLMREYPIDANGRPSQTPVLDFERGPGVQSMTYRMPTADHDRIKREYWRQWGSWPTEAQIGEIYRYGPRGGK